MGEPTTAARRGAPRAGAKPSVVAAVDPGSLWTRAVIAECSDGGLRVLGAGTSRSEGLSRGNVASMPAAASSVARALRDAEESAGLRVHSLAVLLGGESIRGMSSLGSTPVESEDGRVSPRDIDRALMRAGSVGLPKNRVVVHILPQRFRVDSLCETDEPLGLAGSRLEAACHVICAWQQGVENLRRAVRMAGLQADYVVAGPLAAYLAESPEGGSPGLIHLDIGAETTKVLGSEGARVTLSRVIPSGGSDVTRSIALKLGIDPRSAEELKCVWGAASPDALSEAEQNAALSSPAVDGRRLVELTARRLAEIIGSGVEKILVEVRALIEGEGGAGRFPGGVRLSGGLARLRGMEAKASSVLALPASRLDARLGELSGPENAGIAGLVRYAANAPERRGARRARRGLAAALAGGWSWLLESF